MFRKNKERAQERATEYATCRDFQQIFTEDMAGLHQLAYLLTADKAIAEACFVGGLEESIHGNPVFKQWARAWSKRAIIQKAIKTMAPLPPRQGEAMAERESAQGEEHEHPLVAAVATWPIFERFVFVMAVLEGYSLRECATLLACPVQDVMAAKSSALQRLSVLNVAPSAAADSKSLPWAIAFARTQVA